MDEFKKLNWLWKGCGSTPSTLYKNQFSDDEKDIFFCHLNEIDHIHLLDDYGLGNNPRTTDNSFVRTDPRTGQEITKEWFDHGTVPKTTLFADFPQRSAMNLQQHRSCLNALEKLKCDPNEISANDRNDIRIYGELSLERIREKTKFYEFVKSEFYRRNIKNCYALQPELDKFITKRWNDYVQSALTSNNNCYQLQSAIPICQAGSDDDLSVEHVKTVSETGVVLLVNSNKYRHTVPLSCPFLDNFFSNDSAITVPLDDSIVHSDSVDVVISLRTLTSILTSARIQSTDWNVTFSVKECNNRKVIVFNELLPALSLGCLEKNRLAYKYGLKANVVVPKKKEVFSFEANQFIERFETGLDGYPTSQPLQESASTYKVWEYGEYLTKFGSSPTSNPTLDSNHIRRLWNVKRNGVDCCRLLIDSSQDFCEKQKDGSVRLVNLSPKLEYQSEFGAEQMTMAELISEWCALRFGANTVTHRVRVNAKTGCVTEKTEVTVSDVERDLDRLYQIEPMVLLVTLLNCIEIIRQFPSHEYLLSHLEKHNAQAMVYVKSNETSSSSTIRIADIYKSHQSNVSGHLETIQWIPIDDTIRTTIHTAVMPCAFPHCIKKVNGKKRVAQCNDRLRIVEKALRKDREKKEKEQTKQKLIKKSKALKKLEVNRKKKKLLLAQRPKFEGESIDPNELFDAKGNINIFERVSCGADEEKNDRSDERDSASGAVCFETYCRDAATVPEDSFDL